MVPIQNGKYVAPTWSNNTPPAINAEELQAMSDMITQNQDKYTKEQSLSSSTAALYTGLPDNPTPDDVFALISEMIYLATSGKAKVTVTVKLSDGTPIPDACIGGLTTQTGGDVFTGPDGKAIGYGVAGSSSISVSNMLDITSNTQTVSLAAGGSYAVELTAQTRNFVEYTSSQSKVYISGVATRVDVSAGGGGGGATQRDSYYGGGGGGGGGYAVISENVSFKTRQPYRVDVGSGGSLTTTTGTRYYGGTSSFLGVSASGGQSGEKRLATGVAISGGVGNGNGGGADAGNHWYNGSPGAQRMYISFTETSLYGGGGGGQNKNGGSPGGGKGGISGQTNGEAGKDGLGGGGGSGGDSNGQRGGSGKVAVRIYFEEDLAA